MRFDDAVLLVLGMILLSTVMKTLKVDVSTDPLHIRVRQALTFNRCAFEQGQMQYIIERGNDCSMKRNTIKINLPPF